VLDVVCAAAGVVAGGEGTGDADVVGAGATGVEVVGAGAGAGADVPQSQDMTNRPTLVGSKNSKRL